MAAPFRMIATPRAVAALYKREEALKPTARLAPIIIDGQDGGSLVGLLGSVFREVNETHPYDADPEGQDTVGIWRWIWVRSWTAAIGWVKRRGGDCDDFAVEYKRRLMALGISPAALRLARCKTETGVTHMVLMVVVSSGAAFVLDQRKPFFARMTAAIFAGYKWLDREIPGDPEHWEDLRPPRKFSFGELLGKAG